MCSDGASVAKTRVAGRQTAAEECTQASKHIRLGVVCSMDCTQASKHIRLGVVCSMDWDWGHHIIK